MGKKKPNAFAELHDLHNSCIEQLTTLAAPSMKLIEPGIIDKVEDREKTDRLIGLLKDDIKTYRNEANAILQEHKEWKGRPKRPNQYHDAFVVGNKYIELTDKIVSTATPIALELTEILEKALTKTESNENV